MSATLESYVNRPVSVITSDGRNFVGTLKVSHKIQANLQCSVNFTLSPLAISRDLIRLLTSSWMRRTRECTVPARGWSRLSRICINR